MYADFQSRAPAANVEPPLPPELARLLRSREAATGRLSIDGLFAENGQILVNPSNRWARGRPDIQAFLGNIAPGRRYSAIAYGLDGRSGWITGVLQRGDPRRDVGSFAMALTRGQDEVWRIQSELTVLMPPPDYSGPITAESLIARLDEAGIRYGVVLSLGYFWGRSFPEPATAQELAQVRAENDWTAEQAARFPQRLVAFCGVNPLRSYAIAEMERCARLPSVAGMKLHFANSGVDLTDPDHVARMRRFFARANQLGMAIVAHVMPRDEGAYDARHSRALLEQVLPAAPDIVVQIAHLAGTGPGYGPDEPMAIFAEAFERRDPRLANVYIDVAGIATDGQAEDVSRLMARRLRQVGLQRILFGADMHPNPSPERAWSTFRRELGLTQEELRTVAGNRAPYLSGRHGR